MSAYMVDPGHIDFLVKAVRSFDIRFAFMLPEGSEEKQEVLLTSLSDTDLGKALVASNLLSMKERYGDSLSEDELTAVDRYEHRTSPLPMHPVQILKAADCFEYQSCEYAGWKDSVAHSIIEAIRGKAIRALPGYSSAQWEISRDYANES